MRLQTITCWKISFQLVSIVLSCSPTCGISQCAIFSIILNDIQLREFNIRIYYQRVCHIPHEYQILGCMWDYVNNRETTERQNEIRCVLLDQASYWMEAVGLITVVPVCFYIGLNFIIMCELVESIVQNCYGAITQNVKWPDKSNYLRCMTWRTHSGYLNLRLSIIMEHTWVSCGNVSNFIAHDRTNVSLRKWKNLL